MEYINTMHTISDTMCAFIVCVVMVTMLHISPTAGRLIGPPDYPCYDQCKCTTHGQDLEVDCSHRRLTSIPRLTPNVTMLILNDNRISKVSPADLEPYKYLRSLDLSENLLDNPGLAGDVFQHQADLLFLNLSFNTFTTWPDGVLVYLRSVKELDLMGIFKYDATIPNPGYPRYLPRPSSEVLPPGFRSLTKLERLHLDNNGVDFSQTFFANLAKVRLKFLAIGHVQWANPNAPPHNVSYRAMTISSDAFEGFINTSLVELHIFHCHIQIVEANAFQPLNHLDTLELTNTFHSSVIQHGAFSGLNALRCLILDNNVWSEINFPVDILQDMHSSQLVSISLKGASGNINLSPRSFAVLRQRDIELDLSHSSINHISNGTFSVIEHLTKLSMVNATILSGESAIFSEIPSLRFLDLSGLTIASGVPEHFHDLPQIHTLNLSRVEPIDREYTLPHNAFTNSSSLSVLILSTAALTAFPLEAIRSLKLNVMDVRDNHITSVSQSAVDKYLMAGHMRRFYGSNNPYQCTCDLLPYAEWLTSTAYLGDDIDRYQCVHMKLSLEEYWSENACKTSPRTGPLVAITVMVPIFVILSGIFAYQFRKRQTRRELENQRLEEARIQEEQRQLLAEREQLHYTAMQHERELYREREVQHELEIKLRREREAQDEKEIQRQREIVHQRELQRERELAHQRELNELELQHQREMTRQRELQHQQKLQQRQRLLEHRAAHNEQVIQHQQELQGLYQEQRQYELRHLKEMQHRREMAHSNPGQNQEFRFDAFLSCCSEDWPIVKLHFVNQLEKRRPVFRLALAARDFDGGRSIIDNVVEFIDISRKTLLILSNNAIDDRWTAFECDIARSKVGDGRDVLIVILQQDISQRMHALPYSLARLIDLNVNIFKWQGGAEEKELFWKNLKECLQGSDQ